MIDTEKLYLKINAQELYDTIGSLYSEEVKDGIMKLPKALHKYRDTIAKIYSLAELLNVNLEDKLQ